jgi:Sulfotransferase family
VARHARRRVEPAGEGLTAVKRGPIFVAGPERSGTSLVYALLASHSNIAMTRRTNLWTHFYNQYGDLADDANLDRCLQMMMRYRRLAKLDPDPERLRRDFRNGPATYERLFALLEQQYADGLGRPRWGDKSLNTERYTDVIIAAYPRARVIHMMRDPRDRYASQKTRWQGRRGGVGAGTAEWLASARAAVRNEGRYPANVLVLRYEDLVCQPDASMRRVCDFIDEPYTDAMLTLDGAPVFRDKGSNSSYGPRTSGTISSDSVGKFRRVLSPTEITFIQNTTVSEMAHFGYDPEPQHLAAPLRLRFVVGNLPWETCRLMAWRVREAVRNRRGRPVPSYRLVETGTPT